MSIATFVVPGEPVALGRARVAVISGHPRLYTPEKSVTHKTAVAWAAKAAGVVLTEEPCGLDVVFSWLYPRSWSETRIRADVERLRSSASYLGAPKATKPDVDNCAKLVADSLNGIAWKDDAQVTMMRGAKVWGPRAETYVRIWTGDIPPPFPERWWTR